MNEKHIMRMLTHGRQIERGTRVKALTCTCHFCTHSTFFHNEDQMLLLLVISAMEINISYYSKQMILEYLSS